MKTSAWIVFGYGLLVLVGGMMGYFKGGSTASLYTGGGFGLLLLGTSYALFRGKSVAQYAAFLLTLILELFFLWRYTSTHGFVPALMSLFGLAVLIILGLRIKKLKK